MPQFIELSTHSSKAGSLSIFEKLLPSDIKRVFYIYGVPPHEERAKHSHKKAWNALICVAGSCRVYVKNQDNETHFELQQPNQCLILEPGDWHIMNQFTSDAVLLVLSNEYYDKSDYIFEKP